MINKRLKNFPIGDSDFASIIEGNKLYIDKTELIYNLITTGKYYFLSRPRRFGKSLLISTLYEIFKGHKELFKDFYIYKTDYEWEEHPIITINFNKITNDNPETMEKDLRVRLRKIGENYGVEVDKELSIKMYFTELMEKLYKKVGRGVVILIDEYDKPIIEHIGKGKEELRRAEENRDFLKKFYGTIKDSQDNIETRFVFITGITKFSKVSIFSELNNLKDLTMLSDYNELLGITEEEIDEYLKSYIEYFCEDKGIDCKELREELRKYYNGYRFSRKDVSVYNPFSLFNALDSREIKNYWFETGTPTYLINLIKEQDIYIPDYEEYELSSSQFSIYELENLTIMPIMFQTGYLTIKDYDEENDLYVLSYPNKEVKISFTESLLNKIYLREGDSKYKKIRGTLNRGKIEEAIEIIKSIYSEIPYTILGKNRITENYFHMIFYLIMSASGVGVSTEVLTSKGRIDLVVETRDSYYIIEFKCNQEAGKAIEQIKEKGYYEKYKKRGKEIVLIGINFSTQERNITEYEVANLK